MSHYLPGRRLKTQGDTPMPASAKGKHKAWSPGLGLALGNEDEGQPFLIVIQLGGGHEAIYVATATTVRPRASQILEATGKESAQPRLLPISIAAELRQPRPLGKWAKVCTEGRGGRQGGWAGASRVWGRAAPLRPSPSPTSAR